MSKPLKSNIWDSPILKQRFAIEGAFEGANGFPNKANYYFLVPTPESPRSQAAIILQNYIENGYDVSPHELQIGFADELRYQLQKEVGHDGYWIVGWTHPPVASPVLIDHDTVWGRLVIIWLDEDADPKISMDFERPFADLIGDGGRYFIQQAEKAYEIWAAEYGKKNIKKDMGLSDDQITKPVQSSLH